jgi:hypothetical protein
MPKVLSKPSRRRRSEASSTKQPSMKLFALASMAMVPTPLTATRKSGRLMLARCAAGIVSGVWSRQR